MPPFLLYIKILQFNILVFFVLIFFKHQSLYNVFHIISGVYTTEIDSQQHKAIVTGNVDADTLIKKLTRTGKHAELWPEISDTKGKGSGKSKNKKKQMNEPKDLGNTSDIGDEKDLGDNSAKDGGSGKASQDDPALKDPSPDAGDLDDNDGETEDVAQESGGAGAAAGNGGKKKKKKKKGKGSNTANGGGAGESISVGNAPASTGLFSPAKSVDPLTVPMLIPPQQQVLYPYPPQSYYPTPVYGMSYSNVYPSANSSYYSPPVYAFAQSQPSTYPSPPPSNQISVFDYDEDDHDYYNGEKGCSIMWRNNLFGDFEWI